jgi:general secretion pathway protein L
MVQWSATAPNALPAHNDQVKTGRLDDAILAAKGKRITLIVPAADLVLSSVSLPIRQHNKLLQAAPYALEEQLAEDVEKLHFAIGTKQADGSVPVASVSKREFSDWLAPFEEAKLEVSSVYPETLCLPNVRTESGWMILIDGRDCVIRNGAFSGFCCDVSELEDFLTIAISDVELPEGLRVRIYKTPGTVFAGFSTLEVNVETVEVKSALASLSAVTDPANINLLQGSFATEPAYERWWRPIRTTAILFLCWVLVGTAYDAVQYLRLSGQVAALESENTARFQQLFPRVTRIVDMRAQGEQQITLLRQDGAGAGLFPMLGATAAVLNAVPELVIQELQMRDGLLYLSITATDIQSLEKLRTYFENHAKWQLEVQSANAGADGVQIRASLRANS